MAIKTKRMLSKTKSCSCSMPGVWRAVAYSNGAVVIFHSPRACAHVSRSMDINSQYRALANGVHENISSIPVVSSLLQEKHSIFGGADRLRACIDDVINTYQPQCLVIANSCVAGVIGDDVEAVGKETEEKYAVPVITVPCYGFLDGEYYQGYFSVAKQLVERFLKPQPKEENTVLLLGDNGGPWGHYAKEVTRLLEGFSLRVIGQFPGYVAIDDLPKLTAASFSIILGGRGQTFTGLTKIAQLLQERFSVPYLQGSYPVGWDNTICWLQNLGKFLQQEALAEQIIANEKKRLEDFATQVKRVTKGKRCVVCIGRMLMYFHPGGVLETLQRLGLEVEAIILFDNYSAKEKKLMTEAIQAQCQLPIISADEGQQLLESTDLVLTTHEITNNQELRQIFLPMLPLVGVSGEIEFMDCIYKTLCRRGQKGGIVYV